MDYLKLLEESFLVEKAGDVSLGKFEFLSENIFDFTLYDGGMDKFFGEKALAVCNAITNKKTFEYIEDKENYKWYLALCNMPFFSSKLDWGGSIRGAWWGIYNDDTFEISSCGLWQNNEQLLSLKLNEKNWSLFIAAMNNFVNATIAN